ncbi:LOW QUALITY PROTEIN: protein Dok-7 [Aplochiton taeniatus]
MTDTVIAEGQVKFRDGKKWKSRWIVLRKPSPVADCLSVLVYKDRKEKTLGHKQRVAVILESVCGVEPGSGYDGLAYTLSILCLERSVVLGFDTREGLLAWDSRLRYSLGEVHRFSVQVQPGTKLESGPASLHLCNSLLVLTRDLPPAVIGQWKLSDLRRYGAVPNGFVFEGGTRCGYWAGAFFLSCSEGEQISFLLDCMVRGLSPSKRPHGVGPALPDPRACSSVEKIDLEASELERRLSILSHCSSHSSTASTYSFSTSVAGDDRSSLSSSSSGQSDTSYSSRLPVWAEPATRPHLSTETLSARSPSKSPSNLDDRLYAAVTLGPVIGPPSKQLHLRGLYDSGRQSSLDSGIGIAASSQSSSYGSFSSCTGSLDAASHGAGEEFGSQISLPPPVPPRPSPALTILPPERGSVTPTPCSCPSRPDSSASGASQRQSEEYQVPSLLRLRYDSPRTLLQSLTLRGSPAQGGALESGRGRRNGGGSGGGGGSHGAGWRESPTEPPPHGVGDDRRRPPEERGWPWAGERAPSVGSVGRCGSRSSSVGTALLPGGPVGGVTQGTCSPIPGLPASTTVHGKLALRSHTLLSDPQSLYVLMDYYRTTDQRMEEHRNALRFPQEPLPPVSLGSKYRHGDGTATYVNIPVSPVANANRDPLYMELDLGRSVTPSPVSSLPPAVRGGGSTRYAHIDIAATETAQKVGAEHAQGREDGLNQLKARRKGIHQ